MKIRIADTTDKEKWDSYILNHPHGLAYHLFAWREAVKRAYGFDGTYLIAEHNYRQVKGVLPLIDLRIPFISGKFISLPYCDAGGILADSTDIEKKLIHAALDISFRFSKRVKCITIRSTSPFAGLEPELTLNRGKVRMILDLPSCSDQLLHSLKAKVRSQINKPIRDGLSSKIGGKELINEFYPLFSENMRDLGSPVHSRKWFKSIMESYGNRAHVVIVFMPDKTPAAGGIILCHSSTVSVPWASSLKRYNRWNPNMLLYWTFLKFASDSGYGTFDFGRSTPGEGTFKFKKQWGTTPEPLHWADFKRSESGGFEISPELQKQLIKSSEPGQALRKAGEEFFMNLPLSLSKCIAPMLRRYLSL